VAQEGQQGMEMQQQDKDMQQHDSQCRTRTTYGQEPQESKENRADMQEKA